MSAGYDDPAVLVHARLITRVIGARLVRIEAFGQESFPYIPGLAGGSHWLGVPKHAVTENLDALFDTSRLLVAALRRDPNTPLIAHRGLILRIEAEVGEFLGQGSLASRP